MRYLSEARIVSLTEEELANWKREQGELVVCHHGRYWTQIRTGFYQPIHLLAPLSVDQATCPVVLSWGFRAALCADDSSIANGSIPIHLLSDLESYDLQKFSKNRRKHLQKYLKQIEFVELITPKLLQEQGYEVYLSAMGRTGYAKPISRENYLQNLKSYVMPGQRLLLAGLIDGKLGGYLSGVVVEGTAYMEDRIVATEALKTGINTGLTYNFVQLCRRNNVIERIVSGQHCREDESLCAFKESMGFPIEHIPAKVQMNPIIERFIHWRYPDKYYRLTGNSINYRELHERASN